MIKIPKELLLSEEDVTKMISDKERYGITSYRFDNRTKQYTFTQNKTKYKYTTHIGAKMQFVQTKEN